MCAPLCCRLQWKPLWLCKGPPFQGRPLPDTPYRWRFVRLRAAIPHSASSPLSPSLVGGRADRPIFHLVLNWARNLYPYFANTERGEGAGITLARSGDGRGGHDAWRKFWHRQQNELQLRQSRFSVSAASVRPSDRPSDISPPRLFLSPFAIHPLPIAKTTAACANSAGLSYAGRCGGGYLPTRLMPA